MQLTAGYIFVVWYIYISIPSPSTGESFSFSRKTWWRSSPTTGSLTHSGLCWGWEVFVTWHVEHWLCFKGQGPQRFLVIHSVSPQATDLTSVMDLPGPMTVFIPTSSAFDAMTEGYMDYLTSEKVIHQPQRHHSIYCCVLTRHRPLNVHNRVATNWWSSWGTTLSHLHL